MGDSLTLIINRIISVSLTIVGIILKGSYKKAQRWRDRYANLGTTHFPFNITHRLYYTTKFKCWFDGQAIIWTPDYPESWLQKFRPGSVGIDVGAHRGYFSLTFGRRYAGNIKIIAIEPESNNFLALLKNISFNKAFWITPLPFAIWNRKCSLSVIHGREVSFGSFTHVLKESDDGEIMGYPLDYIYEILSLSRVDWIKIDVEGAEIKILEGAQKLLSICKPDIWMEFHLPFHEIEEALARVGYVVKARRDFRENFGALWAVPLVT